MERRNRSNPEAQYLAEVFATSINLPAPRPTARKAINRQYFIDLADYIEDTPHDPFDLTTQASYKALLKEIIPQGQLILASGYTVEPFPGLGEPYRNSAEMLDDIADNKHLYFLRTEEEFGTAGGHQDVPEELRNNLLLEPSPLILNGHQLNVNEVLRFVHDFYGHAPEGNDFGPQGEFNALLMHSQMFSPEAQPALLSEVFMQTCWFYYGRHIRRADGSVPLRTDPDFTPYDKRPFANPKSILPSAELLRRMLDEVPK
jgi:hypothetical protein